MKQNISMDVEIHGTGYHFETLSVKLGASPTQFCPNDHREDALHFTRWSVSTRESHEKEFRINLRSDTFLNHTTDLLIRCHQKQEKIRKSLDDIHLTQPGQLAKLQDDYLKISEINRLLGDAIEVNLMVFGDDLKTEHP